MTYLGVSDLKKSKEMWATLAREKELVLTKDGKPGALIIEISPEGLETTVAAIRRALFSEAISSARQRATLNSPDAEEIDRAIRTVRHGRK